MSKLVKTILVIVLLYVFQFFVTPFLFPTYYPISNEAYIIFVITLIVFLSIGFCVINNNLTYWVISDVVYALLIILCCTNGSYGIGYSGLSLDGLQPSYSPKSTFVGAVIATVVVLIIQLLIKGISISYKKIKNKNNLH